MSTQDFITELLCRMDDQMGDLPKHSQAKRALGIAILCLLGFLVTL